MAQEDGLLAGGSCSLCIFLGTRGEGDSTNGDLRVPGLAEYELGVARGGQSEATSKMLASGWETDSQEGVVVSATQSGESEHLK